MSLPASRLAACLLMALPLAGGTPAEESAEAGSLITLWANDAVSAAFSFETGSFAPVIVDGQGVLDTAQIAFNLFEPNKLTVGFVREVGVRVVDLGENDAVPAYTLSSDRSARVSISKFHTLFLQGSTLYYRAPIGKTIAERGKDVDSVFFTLPPDGIASWEPLAGHTYVMRWAPQRAQRAQERFVKFHIIDFQPGRSVTLRWAKLVPVK
ncbi:MAG: hypothetical protein U1E76_07540 [Planctomycetota bacterium]